VSMFECFLLHLSQLDSRLLMDMHLRGGLGMADV